MVIVIDPRKYKRRGGGAIKAKAKEKD